VGPASRDIGHPDYLEAVTAFDGRALAPLAPVHLKARHTDDGRTVTWIRRTRIDGDGWEAAEVPLGEESERYRVEVLAGERVLRVAEVGTPLFVYPRAAELADFGAPQSAIRFRIAQLSQVFGPGAAADATV
jgi:hypothetical protein